MDQGLGQATILTAFIAGLLSFFSPCVIPLIPSYISYITGITFGELTQETLPGKIRILTALHSLFFILGFTAVFVLLGLSLSLLGSFILKNNRMIEKIGGIIVVLFGLQIAGVIKLNFLQREKKFEIKTKPLGYLGSFLVGATFSLGWTPCVGPILSSILILSSTAGEARRGAALLLSYSMGLGLPFFLSGILINNFLGYFGRIKKYLRIISAVSGIFIIIVGALLFTGYFKKLLHIFG